MAYNDIIETFEGSIIQHGSYNDRIYLIKLVPEASSITPRNLIDSMLYFPSPGKNKSDQKLKGGQRRGIHGFPCHEHLFHPKIFQGHGFIKNILVQNNKISQFFRGQTAPVFFLKSCPGTVDCKGTKGLPP